jgi:hypothetical protein
MGLTGVRTRRAPWFWIAILSAIVLAAAAGTWFVGGRVLPTTRIRVSNVQAEIANQLPKGSSEADAVAFLQGRKYAPVPARPVTASDGFLRAQGVPLGTPVIGGYITDTSRQWFSTGAITIFIVLDENRRVDRAYVFEQLTGP